MPAGIRYSVSLQDLKQAAFLMDLRTQRLTDFRWNDFLSVTGMENSFTISFFHEGELHKGIITPSEKVGGNGMPVYFRVALDGHFFGYLCCGDPGWTIDQDRPPGIVDKIGEEVQWHYTSISNNRTGI